MIRGLFLFYAALFRLKQNKPNIRQKWPQKKWILGHRGARANAPENTLTAFRKAMEYGADGVEFDVFLSKDAVPIVIHDETVDRTTDGHGNVQDFSAIQLSKLNAARNFPQLAKEGVPTLVQVLEMLPDEAIVNVELKGSGHFSKQIFIEKLLPIFKKHEQRLCLIISSFDGELLYLLRLQEPRYLIGLLLSPKDENWPKALCYIKAIAPDAFHLPAELAALPFVLWLAKRKQVHIAVWTVNDQSQAKALLRRGVSGIFTDQVPEIVAACLIASACFASFQ